MSDEITIEITNGYDILLRSGDSNLGWRVLIRFYYDDKRIKEIMTESDTLKLMVEILDPKFLKQQRRVVEIIKLIKDKGDFNDELQNEFKNLLGNHYDELINYYTPKEAEKVAEPDKTKPSILLTSFVGCKGLSAGHVIIVGANDGSIPKHPGNINDVEIAQFMVALTRTRKKCHIVSNLWHIAPVLKGALQPKFKKSSFLNWIPSELIQDEGVLAANDLK